jgi:protocatechuate 3,4-dioxygenase, beta subunit
MHDISRRHFVASLPALAIALPEAVSAASDARSTLTIATAGEPGQRLIVTGTIVGTDRKTPLPNMRLSVYHTDNDGYYSRPVDDPRNARLRGALVTDASGRYEIRTIWPGHYPGGGNPRHIHVHLAGPDVPEHWIDSFLFEGDRYFRGEEVRQSGALGPGFGFVMAMTSGPDGVIRCARNIRLDRDIAERNKLVNGWYRNGEEPEKNAE